MPGLIVDVFGDAAYASEIVGAATAQLADRDVDVVITNISHRDWLSGHRRKGFITWSSQFPHLASRALAGRIGQLDAAMPQMHLSRSDSEGSIICIDACPKVPRRKGGRGWHCQCATTAPQELRSGSV